MSDIYDAQTRVTYMESQTQAQVTGHSPSSEPAPIHRLVASGRPRHLGEPLPLKLRDGKDPVGPSCQPGALDERAFVQAQSQPVHSRL